MEKWVSDRPDLMIEKVWVPEEESREITLRQLSGRKRGAERNEATRKAHLKSQYALQNELADEEFVLAAVIDANRKHKVFGKHTIPKEHHEYR